MSVLEIKDLRITLINRPLVDGVSLLVDAGEIVGLAGESGSGKTLTALTALGFTPPSAQTGGQVLLHGQNMLDASASELRRVRGRKVAAVFQDPMTSLHPMLTIERQLTEHQRVHLGATRRQARERAIELLDMVQIPEPQKAIRSYPHRFSGGMRQRIAIASALAGEPELLIADEITTALDVTVQAGILHLLVELRQQTGMAILFITHDLAVMNVLTERLYVMQSGRVVETGKSRDVLADPTHEYTRELIRALPADEQLHANKQRFVNEHTFAN